MTNREWLRTLNVDDLASAIKIACEKGISMWLNQEHKEKLKPCANCGGKAEFVVDAMGINPEIGYVQCCECHIRTSVGKKHDVVNTWNRRVDNADEQKHKEEIKPCKCGGKPFVNKDSVYYWVSCSCCGVHGTYGTTREQAIEAWNRWVDDDKTSSYRHK